jgi:hypothetical protein
MKTILLAAALLAFSGTAHGLEEVVEMKTYRMNGKPVQVWTDAHMDVEMRFIPGWQLDPKCPRARWGEDDCPPGGGQGFLFFEGFNSGEATFHGKARTDKCPEMFQAYADFDKRGRLTIYQTNTVRGRGSFAGINVEHVIRNSKCNVVLQPAKDPRR